MKCHFQLRVIDGLLVKSSLWRKYTLELLPFGPLVHSFLVILEGGVLLGPPL